MFWSQLPEAIVIVIPTNGLSWCLCHIPPQTKLILFSFCRFTYFEVAQLLKATEVEEVFVKSGLKSEYETYVVPLMKRQ